MKKLLTAIFAISVTVPAFALTVTGTILDGDSQEPLYTATVQQVDNPQNGTTANESGAFSITVPDANTELTFRYMGMKTKNITAAQANGNTIIMETDTEMLKDIVITSCTKNSVANAKSILYNKATEKCVPTECESARYKLTGQTTATKINQNSCTTDSADQCENDDTSCTTITIGDACVDQVGMDCTATAGDHVRTAKYEWDGNKLNCVIKKCDDHFMLDNGVCTASDGPCSDAQIAEIEHAKSGELKRGKCHVTECDTGYEVSNNTCVAVGGDCKSLPDDAISGTRKWDAENQKEICIVTECESGYSISDDKLSCQSKLSEADSQKRVNELRENAKKMHDKETSTANKLIGAAGIGATGIGTSQALSALSEQRADNRAEDDMRAYLATIKCDYGTGKTVNGGETGIELPGGNELTQYAPQYKTLAADLKVRKTALGMSPGIESETIIDAAETGLYDNAATGKTNGAFTSLSRALSDETSADAQAWAQQKADTASKLKTGAIVAGVGAVGSAIANLAVNSGADKQNKSDEILARYASKYTQELQAVIDNVEQQTKTTQCADFTGAKGTFPNCQCSGANQYFTVDGGCITCDGGRVVNADKTGCECPSNLPVYKDGQCIAKTPDCNLSGLKHSDKCECIANAHTDSNNKCVCNTDYTENDDGVCIKDQPATTTLPTAITLNIDSDTFFDSGRATVKNAKDLTNDLQKQINEQTELVWDNLTYCVSVTGHTDRTRFRRHSGMNNQILSERRAKAVEQIMRQVFTMGTPKFQSSGKGASECTAPTYKRNDERCRHVRIVITAGTCANTNADMKTSAITAAAAAVADATSQNAEKGDEKTDKQKVEKQETPTATPATDTDSTNTSKTTVGATNDVSNNTNAEKGGKKTDEQKVEKQETQTDTPATGADSTNTSKTTVGAINDVSNNTNAEKGDEKTDNPTESKKIDQQNSETNEQRNPAVTKSSQPLSDDAVRRAMSNFVSACENYSDSTGTIGKFFVNDRVIKYSNSTHPAQDAYCIFLKPTSNPATSGANDPQIKKITTKTINDLDLNMEKLKTSIPDGKILSADSSRGSKRCQQTFANINAPKNTAYQGQNISIDDSYTSCKFVLQDISQI